MAANNDRGAYGRGCVRFLEDFHESLGVQFDGRRMKPTYPKGDDGRPTKTPGTLRADEYSIRYLAEAILGHDFVDEYYQPSGGFDFTNRQLMESAIDPTAFLNINVFNLSVAGLVNAEIMDRFQLASRIGDQLCTTKPTTMNGQKLIGIASVGKYTTTAKNRQPGERHAEVGFGEMYQTTPQTLEQALKCPVTKEAVFFDLTGDVLEVAGSIGDELGYGRELDLINEFIGVTNTYNFKGTSYNTYQGTSPWVNTLSNPFSDWQDVDDSRQLFIGRTDPITSKEILVEGQDVLVMPQREFIWRHTLNLTQVVRNTQFGASQYPSVQGYGGNPLAQMGGLNLLTSVIAYNRHTASDGLALSAANAKEYWYHGDFKKALWWMENWPLTPWQASADEYVMKDQGLVAVFGANYRGVPYMREPRYLNQNTN